MRPKPVMQFLPTITVVVLALLTRLGVLYAQPPTETTLPLPMTVLLPMVYDSSKREPRPEEPHLQVLVVRIPNKRRPGGCYEPMRAGCRVHHWRP